MQISYKAALITTSVIAICFFTLYMISTFLLQSTMTEYGSVNRTIITEMAADILDSQIAYLKLNVEIVAEKITATPPEEWPDSFLLAQRYNPGFLGFAVFAQSGRIAAHGDLPAPGGRLDSPYLRDAFSGKTTISTTREHPDAEGTVIYVSTPIDDLRVLSVTIDGLAFQRHLNTFRMWKQNQFFVMDEYNAVIAHSNRQYVTRRSSSADIAPNDHLSFVDIAAEVEKLGGHPSGSGAFAHDGTNYLFDYSTLPNGWRVGIFVPEAGTVGAISSRVLLWATLGSLGFISIAVFFLSGRIARRFLWIEERNRELQSLNEIVAASDRARTQFLANMSHEIRTPLNAIIGLTEAMLATDHESREERTENLEKVFTASNMLLGIVNDILDISKIRSGKFEITPTTYHLPSVINDTVTQSMVHIGDKSIKLRLWVDPKAPAHLEGDDLRVRQVINNLLSNAFKYTHAGTVSVDVACEKGEGDDVWLLLTVADTGVGIRKEEITKIFRDYYQPSTEANRKIQGTGLGLALAKQLIEMMDGTIAVESVYGRGSVFKVRVRQKRTDDMSVGEEVAQNLTQFRYVNRSTVVRDLDGEQEVMQLPYARVLVVDDVATNLDVAKSLMRPYGMKIDCVTSGQAAINLIKAAKVKYNAVFMDHMMPGMDGIETVRIIREEIGTEYARTVPVIALTANAVAGVESLFLQNGFQAFVSKPIDTTKLYLVIRQWVRDKEVEAEAGSTDHPSGPLLASQPEEGTPPALASVNRRGAGRRRFPDRRRRDTTTIFPSPWAEGEVDGLNIERGLARFNNDMDAYLRIAESFVRHTPALLEKVKRVAPETLPDYSITIHGLKTSFRNISAESLGNQAEALEKAAKTGDFTFVSTHTPALVGAAEALLTALAAKLKTSLNRKPARDEPDPVVLDEVRAACETFDIDRLGEAMKTLASHEYNSPAGAELVAWLEEKTYRLDFKGIAVRLADIRSEP